MSTLALVQVSPRTLRELDHRAAFIAATVDSMA
jgi:hypothetical protein